MSIVKKLIIVAGIAVLSSGCSLMAPKYTASLDNVQTLSNAGDYSASVGGFDSIEAPGNADPISLRGSTMTSPYATYALYVAEALKQELSLAGKLAPDADVEVTGTLRKNDINIPAFGPGSGDIEVRFVVKKTGKIRYDQIKTAHTDWESSFVGAVAIPKGQQEYPRLVQTLLEMLYADENFMSALK